MRPLEYLVTSSANLSLAAACVSLAVALPMSMFMAGVAGFVCPSTVLAANNDAATKATFEIAFITPPKKVRKSGALIVARTAETPIIRT